MSRTAHAPKAAYNPVKVQTLRVKLIRQGLVEPRQTDRTVEVLRHGKQPHALSHINAVLARRAECRHQG